MQKIKNLNLICPALFVPFSLILALFLGCAKNYKINQPDHERFNNIVASSALQDSLRQGKLTPGMSYFVAAEIFADLSGERRVAVPSVGSRQKLKETEGIRRRYVDPNVQIYMDEYETKDGRLNIWYQPANFYVMGVATGDTLYVFNQNESTSSVIECLRDDLRLQTRESFAAVSQTDSLYGEIRHRDHPWREVSRLTMLKLLSDGQTFRLAATSFEFYPIEFIEVEGEPVTSYQWRDSNEDNR